MKVGDFTASLYDLFGYLLPGIVATAAVVLLVSGSLDLVVLTDAVVLMLVLIAAYFIGHLVQAVGNLVFGPKLQRAEAEVLRTLPPKVKERVQSRLKECFADPTDAPDTPFDLAKPREVSAALAFIDEARVLGERDNERDVYVYREGFYRGTVIAFLILGAALSIRAGSGVSIAWGPEGVRSLWLDYGACSIGVLAAVLVSLAYSVRMFRFTGYRVERSIYYWLAVSQGASAGSTAPGAAGGSVAAGGVTNVAGTS